LLAIGLPLAAAVGGFLSFVLTYSSDARNRHFEAYHRLIKDLVEPSEAGNTYVDRQCAVLFEFRRFRRYKPVTIRILCGLREDWQAYRHMSPRLTNELDLTLADLGGDCEKCKEE
jgi:hypothetical protein